MITPLDIQNKEFNRGVRGYKVTEVEKFLDEVIVDYEKLYKENIELKEKIAMLNDQLKHYNHIEETLQNTLVVAQKTAEEVNLNARNKGDHIVKEAESNARKILDEAHNEVLKIQERYETIKEEMMVFKMRFKTLLKSQLETLDQDMGEIREELHNI